MINASASFHFEEETHVRITARMIQVEGQEPSHCLSIGLGVGVDVWATPEQLDQIEQVIKAYRANGYRGSVNNRVQNVSKEGEDA